MRTDTTLNLPITIRHDQDTGFTYCPDFETSLYAPSVNTAKTKMRPLLEQEIKDAITEHRNYQRKVIACKNGEILVVYFRYGQWGYDIAGEGRSGCCTNSGFKSFEDAIERATDHAAQSYGGIAWQC